MAETLIHTASDGVSAEAAAGRLRADGIPVRLEREFPYLGGPATEYRLIVPAHLSRAARRSLGLVEPAPGVDRRDYDLLVVLVVSLVVALVVFALGLAQRLG